MMIDNEISKQFNTIQGRRKMIELYKDSASMFVGVNEDGETVHVSIAESGIVVKTEQDNGWVRVNYYDADGIDDGETFDGRWK